MQMTDLRAIAARTDWLKQLSKPAVDRLMQRAVSLTAQEGKLVYDLEDETGGIFYAG